MAQALGDPLRDALAHYADEFAGLGESLTSPADRLRALFALMLGLGMRESSGKHCEGRDKSASNVDAESAEAGLFQTSFNSRSASPVLPTLITQYQGRTDLADIFSEGVSCSPASWMNWGMGAGRDYQQLTKTCPAFAVDYTAVALRLIRRHWGPITKKRAEVRKDSFRLLRDVEALVQAAGATPFTLAPSTPALTPVVTTLVGLAVAEWEFFGGSTRSISDAWHIVGDEAEEPFTSRVGRYWRAVGNATANGNTPQPWSAAFISWLFHAAEVPPEQFRPSEGHFDYVRHIHLHPGSLRLMPTDTPLAPGDLIWNSRANSPVTSFNLAEAALNGNSFFKSHADIVVEVAPGWCETIGGNVSNRDPGGSVTRSTWRLAANGALADGRKPWVGVIKNGL